MEFSYTVLINPNLERPELVVFLNSGNFNIIEHKIAPIGPLRDWQMYWFLKKYKNKFDLVHVMSSNFPFSLRNGICTIHDMTYKKYFDNPKYTFNLSKKYIDWTMKNCIKYSKAIIAVSKSTKKEIIESFAVTKINEEKINVIYEGWEHLKKDFKAVCKNIEQIPNSYMFYLGTSRKHKNLVGLLNAYKMAEPHLNSNIKLVIAGSQKYINEQNIKLIESINKDEKKVIFTGYLSDECVESYFKNADCLIFPSLSEGFGLPILEAFYYNKTVLCSNTTSLPEVAGNAAFYFNPNDYKNIADVIIKFYSIQEDDEKMSQLRAEQLEKFSWVTAAKETIELYKRTLT